MKVTPVLKSTKCNQELPRWGVTREFRFGQFLQLYDERTINSKRHVTPLKFSADGDITELGGHTSSSGNQQSKNQKVRSVSLNMVFTSNADKVISGEPLTVVDVDDVETLFKNGSVDVNGSVATVDLSEPASNAIRKGYEINTVAYIDGQEPVAITIRPNPGEEILDDKKLSDSIANLKIQTKFGDVKLDKYSIQSLLETGHLYTSASRKTGASRFVHLSVGKNIEAPEAAKPIYPTFLITDLPGFLASPEIPLTQGSALQVKLQSDQVVALRNGSQIELVVNDTKVAVTPTFRPEDLTEEYGVLGFDPGDYSPDRDKIFAERNPLAPIFRGGTDVDAITDSAQITIVPNSNQEPRLSTEGLPVAVLLPWRQTWTLEGFTRGNLLSSIALAPGEETRITVSTWERRAKALEQTAETETEQTFDYTSTTRDTEDVFREVSQSNEFTAQAHASLDASYTMGAASIQLSANGSLSNTNSLSVTAKASTQHVREVVSRASTRVRSRRITTITESRETTTGNETIRHIRNPNECHTLTLNFHEVLAHYKLNTKFNRDLVRIVVLVPNPIDDDSFTSLRVRAHEASLRMNLLNPALADGFEACKLLEAYSHAEKEITRLSMLTKEERDLDRQRLAQKKDDPPPPPNPYADPLIDLMENLKENYKPFRRASPNAAVDKIEEWGTPSRDEVKEANRWLWRQLVLAKFGGSLLNAIESIPESNNLTPAYGRRLVSALPELATTTLDGLGQLPAHDKEKAGLSHVLSVRHGAGLHNWWWWWPRLNDHGLYKVDDGGIPSLLKEIKDLFQKWEVKEGEGGAIQQADAVLENSKQEQQQATIADRLEMKFGAEVIGAAIERREALLHHLNEFKDHYRFVLFQSLPPSEQMRQLLAAAPQLRIGMFEPHVVASDGPNLAVPLTPLAETALAKLVENLSDVLESATKDAAAAGDRIEEDSVILPTPGVSVESWLGSCSACEDHLEGVRAAELRKLEAEARQWEAEADRFEARLAASEPDLSYPGTPASPGIMVHLDNDDG